MAIKKILIIDDEANFCKLVKMNLELLGDFNVSIATDGQKGISLAKSSKPHLILLDIIMPGMDGLEVLRRLKRDDATRPIPVVMLTVKTDQESRSKAAQLFDEAYITKPVEISDLKDKIEEILARRGIS